LRSGHAASDVPAVHAGVDWDWELAAVSLWVFALAGVALARTTRRRSEGSGSLMWALRAGVGALCLVLAVGAVRMLVSADNLARATDAYRAGDCREARAGAKASLAALDSQPQAAAILGYCDALGGRERAAISQMQHAASLDPRHWRYRYGLAIVRGMAGLDPRHDLARARRLNPRSELWRDPLTARLADARPAGWRSLAARLPRPVD
jgi:hypothetical protein